MYLDEIRDLDNRLLQLQKDLAMKKPSHKCVHRWRFLERWIGDKASDTDYIFYCIKCLKITSIKISLKRTFKKSSTKTKKRNNNNG
jgi:hypothetical protein